MKRLKSPALRFFTQPFIQAQTKENIKAPRPGLCAGNSAEAGEFSAQKASNTVNLSIWWRHHVTDTYMRHSASMIPMKLKYRYYMFFKDIALDYIHHKMSAIYFSIRCHVYVLTYFWTYMVPLALCVWWRNAVVVIYQTYQTYILIYFPITKSDSLILQYFFWASQNQIHTRTCHVRRVLKYFVPA